MAFQLSKDTSSYLSGMSSRARANALQQAGLEQGQLDPSVTVYKSGGDTTGSIAEGYTAGEITIATKRDTPKKEIPKDSNTIFGINKYIVIGGLLLLIVGGGAAIYYSKKS